MKKLLAIATVAAVCVAFSVSPADAGSKQRHRWEGVAIGVGAALLGGAIIHDIHRVHHRPVRVYHHREYRPRRYESREYCPPPRRRGHWEEKKVWIPPVYERVWNPGHYDCNNEWIPGRWMRVEKRPGYWKSERVWVSYR